MPLPDSQVICLDSDDDDQAIICLESSSAPKPESKSKPKTTKVVDLTEPSVVRQSYPHYDVETDNVLEKCPVCYMKYRKSELIRHTPECYDKVHCGYVIKGEFKVKINKDGSQTIIGRADGPTIHKSNLPSKHRRVIQPK